MNKQKKADTAEGSTLDEIFRNQGKCDSQVFEIKASNKHVLLYHVPFDERPGIAPHPKRANHRENSQKWDCYHVRLPCSDENKYKVSAKKEKLKWKLITESLLNAIRTSYDLEEAIKSYNSHHASWSFSALHELFRISSPEDTAAFFNDILPAIITIALQLPLLIPGSIPLLKSHKNMSISMSQQQAACLLANAFLCTFPMRNEDSFVNLPTINFNRLFSINEKPILEKLKCIINYFDRVLCKEMPVNVITFQRHSIRKEDYKWEKCDMTFSNTKYRVTSEGTIEDGHGMLQVDFANCLIGGGVLGHGCVQEEIRFVINPEMIVARLFTEKLEDDEALRMIGCEQFSRYRGYASTFEFESDFKDETSVDPFRSRCCRVVAIDALCYKGYEEQFVGTSLKRELIKATAGFSNVPSEDHLPVATGLWGCGAFNGHIVRSALIQLMAAARTGRNIVLYTFGDVKSKEEIGRIYDFLVKKEITIGMLYKKLVDFGKLEPLSPNLLIPFIMEEKKAAPKTLAGMFDYQSPAQSSVVRSHSQSRSESNATKNPQRKLSQP